jgi:acyl-CoA dehydrogenase
MDAHEYHGEIIGTMCKANCTEMMLDCIYNCMQEVGVNSLDLKQEGIGTVPGPVR